MANDVRPMRNSFLTSGMKLTPAVENTVDRIFEEDGMQLGVVETRLLDYIKYGQVLDGKTEEELANEPTHDLNRKIVGDKLVYSDDTLSAIKLKTNQLILESGLRHLSGNKDVINRLIENVSDTVLEHLQGTQEQLDNDSIALNILKGHVEALLVETIQSNPAEYEYAYNNSTDTLEGAQATLTPESQRKADMFVRQELFKHHKSNPEVYDNYSKDKEVVADIIHCSKEMLAQHRFQLEEKTKYMQDKTYVVESNEIAP